MITDEQFQEFLTSIDETVKYILNQDVLDNSKSNIEYCVNAFYSKKYGKDPNDIIWVKQGNTPITEFYSSELNLTWLCTYLKFHNNFLKDSEEEDHHEIFQTCLFLTFVLTKVKGINIIDGNVYLLENDLEFVQYKIDQKLFI